MILMIISLLENINFLQLNTLVIPEQYTYSINNWQNVMQMLLFKFVVFIIN